jgi:hypothetical protein
MRILARGTIGSLNVYVDSAVSMAPPHDAAQDRE